MCYSTEVYVERSPESTIGEKRSERNSTEVRVRGTSLRTLNPKGLGGVCQVTAFLSGCFRVFFRNRFRRTNSDRSNRPRLSNRTPFGGRDLGSRGLSFERPILPSVSPKVLFDTSLLFLFLPFLVRYR